MTKLHGITNARPVQVDGVLLKRGQAALSVSPRTGAFRDPRYKEKWVTTKARAD